MAPFRDRLVPWLVFAMLCWVIVLGCSVALGAHGSGQIKGTVPVNTVLPAISGTATEGQELKTTTGTWELATEYSYQWRDCNTSGESCSNIAGATSNAYLLAHSDVGHQLRMVVTAINAGGSASATSAATATVIEGVACTTTVSETTSAAVNTALKAAKAGDTVCLAEGNWPLLELSGINPASTVTLKPAAGAKVNIKGATLKNGSGGVSRLTTEGFNFTGTFEVSEPPLGNVGHITVRYDTFGVNTTGSTTSGSTIVTEVPTSALERMATGEAVYASNISTTATNLTKISEIHGFPLNEIVLEHPATSTATGEMIGAGPREGVYTKSATAEGRVQEYTTVEHDTFSNLGPCPPENKACSFIGQCFTAGNGKQKHITFSYNVCGPNIPNHYVQISSGENLTVDHNTFLGPPKSETDTLVHQNVLQIFGSSSTVDFSNDIMWETGGSPSVLLEASLGAAATYPGVTMENDLSINNQGSQAVNLCPIKGLTFQHYTVVGSQNGVLLHGFVGEPTGNSYDCLEGREYSVLHNIAVGTKSGSDFGAGGCESSCTIDYTATGDKSAEAQTHHVVSWTPSWTTTVWNPLLELTEGKTPRPPAGYYIPEGLGIEAGYQGGGGV
jgi:hypothetical protein